ncbi:MAG TPA: enoyl-CoA hydratase/isomerase family protein [Solimonas sp.]|nr:enoyl-CoA hydratase/isomerase family protein [Solimonas sp.]
MEVLGLAAIDALSLAPQARRDFSPLSSRRWLLLDTSAVALPERAQERIARWLAELPCPVLGICPFSDASPVARACDVRLEHLDDARPLVAGIERSPIAATVLVQLLRATEGLALADALVAESLAYATLQAGPEFRRWLSTRPAVLPVAAQAGPAVMIEREGDRLSLALNRPASRNAMSVEMRDALVEALELALADDSIRSLRISGRGKCFSTGGELAEFGSAPDPATAHLVRSLALPGRLLAACAAKAEARLHGACVGSGLEFPAFAGRVTATADAWFQLPELQYGLIPGAGGCVSVPRRIGRQRTAWLALSGKRINARTALEWGLVDALEG